MKKKRRKLKDQIFDGAFENMELSNGSKSALFQSGLIILLGAFIAKNINDGKL